MKVIRMRRLKMLALAAAGAILVSNPAVRAAPLDEQACAQLKDEQAQLVKAGTKADLDRGADWAKTNLPPDRLRQIERYITVEEQILFRCPQPKPPRQAASEGSTEKTKRPKHKASPENEAAEAPDGAPQSTKPTPAKTLGAKSEPKPGQPTAKPAAPKPRPKVNDAYSPPRRLTDEGEAQ
jgi:hypothetical protein